MISRFDLKRNKLDIGLFIPTIKVDATYDLKGKLLLLPLVGVGHAKLHLSKSKLQLNKLSKIMNYL
jgi:Haemolymph juvenile hormone binding protein (JHBP).